MNKADAIKLGQEHAKAGKQCTPFDCREVDAQIFAAAKQQSAMSHAKFYAVIRGAFNGAWQAEYFRMVAA